MDETNRDLSRGCGTNDIDAPSPLSPEKYTSGSLEYGPQIGREQAFERDNLGDVEFFY